MSARDKARLDWLQRNQHGVPTPGKHRVVWVANDGLWCVIPYGRTAEARDPTYTTLRQAIDAAMREDARREKGARE